MDKLNRMIQKANALIARKRHYYQMLDKEIKDAVLSYVSSLDKETITVLELLDIREFNKSRRVNGMFSCFARGKAQQKLMQTLNWKASTSLKSCLITPVRFVQSAVISIRQIEMGRASFALAVVTKAMLTILLALTLRLVIWIKTSLRFVKDNKYNHKESCSLS